MNRQFTAFVCYSFAQGIEVAYHLRKRNLRVPDDVSIAVFNNPELAGFTAPAMTCLEIPVREMGVSAAELLLKKYEDGAYRNGETVTFQGKLIVRESTGPCRKP
ncbi:HTH-type transcriptional repressor PurR [bioreactor metagenome]|uniref:HTH-type transcriptional repressor PurR n=1 Tax=bioreactor metagenome TaxID=1076179 RepID=A0A645I4D5_9ZZZZ